MYKTVTIALLLLLLWISHPAHAGNAPVGGGGSCSYSLAFDGTVGQQQPYDNGLYTCLSASSHWTPEAIIVGGTLANGSAPACSSTTAGMVAYTGGAFQYCNGTAWNTFGSINPTSGTLGGTSGVLVELAAGTAAAPSLTFHADTQTGIYQPATGTMAITTDGTEHVAFDASGNLNLVAAAGAYETATTAILTLPSADPTGASLSIGLDAQFYISHTGGGTNGEANTVIGAYAMSGSSSTPLTGAGNTVAGGLLGNGVDTTPSYTTAVGAQSFGSTYNEGSNDYPGNANTAIGDEALNNGLSIDGGTVAYNAVVGYDAAQNPQDGLTNSVAIGNAVAYGVASSAAQTALTAGGDGCVNSGGGLRTICIGQAAPVANSTGADVVGIGYAAISSGTSPTGSQNVALGYDALYSNTTGSDCVAIGAFALQNETTGIDTAFGYQALYSTTTGTKNTAIGYGAMQGVSNTPLTGTGNNTAIGDSALIAIIKSANANTAIGQGTLSDLTTGSLAIAVGVGALDHVTANSITDVAVGYDALHAATSGTTDVAIGYQAMLLATTGSANTAVGTSAMAGATAQTGNGFNVAIGDSALTGIKGAALNNTAIGYDAIATLTAAAVNNTAIGVSALANNGASTNNTAIGVSALATSATGGENTAVGANAGQYISSSSSGDTAIGYQAMLGVSATELQGDSNTAVGSAALFGIESTAEYNTAVGWESLYENTTGISNTAVGTAALQYETTSNSDVAVGAFAMQGVSSAPQTGSGENTAFGASAMAVIQGAAAYDTAFGQNAMSTLTTGSYNTAVGQGAMAGTSSTPLTSGSGQNTGIGMNALFLIAGTAANNTALGYEAGDNITTGAGNIIVGEVGNITTGGTNILIGNSLQNTTAGIGAQIDIGDLIMAKLASSEVAIGTMTYQGTGLSVSGHVWAGSTQLTSDRRLKKDIRSLDEDDSLQRITELRGVTYNWRPPAERAIGKDLSFPSDRQMGVIAQEVAQVFPTAVMSGESGIKSVNYESLLAPLIQAVKQQEMQIADLSGVTEAGHRQIASLKTIVAAQEIQLASLRRRVTQAKAASP